MRRVILSGLVTVMCAGTAIAGEADVVGVEVSKSGNRYSFSVTVSHADEGWDHYADGWEIIGPDGAILGKRVLAHPHVNEQPFTRSGSFELPEGVISVIVRAHDSVHGYGGKKIAVELPE